MELDRGTCGDCVFFRSATGINRSLAEGAGFCVNPNFPRGNEITVFEHFTPRQAIQENGLGEHEIEMDKLNSTCFSPRKIVGEDTSFPTNLEERRRMFFDEGEGYEL